MMVQDSDVYVDDYDANDDNENDEDEKGYYDHH